MTTIQIETVDSKAQLKRFILVQSSIYKDDPNFIVPLMQERLDSLSVGKNPYFEHADHVFFIAVQDGKDVGTISAQIDSLAQEKWGPNLGHFGLFEAACQNIADALFNAAEEWLSARGMKRMQGPWNLSANEQCGMLVKGFDTPPVILMPHGKPDYLNWTEANGFSVTKKLLAFSTDPRSKFDDKMERIASMSRKSKKTVVRDIDMKNFRAELDIILDIFNDAWADNWGYVPMTDAEIEHMAKSLKPIIDPARAKICEFEGKPVSFIITIPDVNYHIRDLNGKLFPFGIFKLIWRLFIKKKHPRFRTPLMGTRKEMQGHRMGMALMFHSILDSHKSVLRDGGEFTEMGWILEDNKGMINMLHATNGVPYKTYHIYEKEI